MDPSSAGSSKMDVSSGGGLSVLSTKGVLAPVGTQTSVTAAIHPLVIMNVSEQWTRLRAQHDSPVQVYGAVVGKLRGRNLELANSFEIVVNELNGQKIVDVEQYKQREAQYKEVFSDLEFLGWYTTGDLTPTVDDVAIHRQISGSRIDEANPVLLKLNPNVQGREKLPLELYESVIDLNSAAAAACGDGSSGSSSVDQLTAIQFVPIGWSLATEEAERIGIDHVARIAPVDTTTEASISKQLVGQYGAVKMLHNRLQLMVEYVKAVEAGQLPRNEAILRDVASLCYRMPIMDDVRFGVQFKNQCNDIKLTAYLGILSKTCATVNQLIMKLNVLHEKQTGGGVINTRRGRGMML